MLRKYLRAALFAATCLQLFNSTQTLAEFPPPALYRHCGPFSCGTPDPLFSTALAVCYHYATSNATNVSVETTPNPIGAYECKGNYEYPGCTEAQAPDGCYLGFSAGPYHACPPNSSGDTTACSCDVEFQQLASSCSGGKNNGEGVGGCNPCKPGNPTNPSNGNKISRQDVYRGLNGFGLFLTFNSYDNLTTRFGWRWRDNFNRRALVEGSNIVVLRPDGVALQFVPSGGAWVPDADIEDQLVELQNPPGTRIGWQLTTAGGDELETYDANGSLVSLQARSGLTQSLVYSDGTTGPNGGFILNNDGNPTTKALPAGLLIRAADSFGRTLEFGYNGVSRLTRMTDPSGGVYRFAYLNQDYLASITFPDGKSRTFAYNESANTGGLNLPGALTGIFDENGDRFATYAYDAERRVTSSEHAGATLRYQFSYGTGSTTVTDPLTAARTYNFQSVLGSHKNTSITGPACPQCGPASQTPDVNGNLGSRVDWNGNRTNYTYDLARNLETSRTEGLTSAGGATPQTRTISTQWDANFRLPAAIAEPLRLTTNVYDADGMQCGARGALCSRSIQATTDANGSLAFGATPTGSPRVWVYAYNANGSVLTVNGPRTEVGDITTYTYYANDDPDLGKRGNLATITNAAGHVTSITAYNAHGQPLAVVDPNGLVTELGYDERLRLTSRNVGGELTGYEYYPTGQLKKVTLPNGSFLAYTYDPAHRLTVITDALGNRISYTLDAMGNRTQEQVLDPLGALAQTRSRVFNSLNRLFQEIGAQNQTTQYAYDNQGNVTSVDGPLAGTVDVTANAYDALNRLRQVTDPSLGVTQYVYNGLDALTQVTDPRNLDTGYTVDGLGNLTLQQSPDTGNTSNTYDPAGNLLTQTDAKGQRTSHVYDALNRVTLITFHDGSKQAYAYDQGTNGLGRLSSITETDPGNQVTSVIAYGYDTHGRVTSETRMLGGQSYVTAYSYDSFGRLSGMTYPSGRTVSHGFDALGRINQVSTAKDGQSNVVVQSVSYHPFGGVTGYTFGNGQLYSRSVDRDGRIFSYSLGGANFTLGFDDASRITGITESGNPNVNSYGYDSLDRLTQAILPFVSYGYGYDAVGNRSTKTAGANTDTYAYSATSNRLASITPSSGPVRTYTHDAVGSITADGANTYAYDARGRMVQAVSSLGTTSYQVNALGQRIRKTNTLGDTVFHYDTQGRLIAESSAAGAVRKEYLYLGDIPVGVVQ